MRGGKEGSLRSTPAWLVTLVLLLVALALSLLTAVTIGSTDIPISDVYHVIFYKLFGAGTRPGARATCSGRCGTSACPG